jgi:hypothetical protein
MATTSDSRFSTNTRASCGLWLMWVVASSVGFASALGAFLVYSDAGRGDFSAGVSTIGFFLTALIVTISPGFLHWLILRQRFSHAGWWIPASGIGSVLGFIMLTWGIAVADTKGGDVGFWPIFHGWVAPGAAVLIGGALAGTMQWLVLRRWVANAGWWIPASSIAWVAVTWTYFTLTRGNDVRLFLSAAASGALSGAIMGLTLVWLLRRGCR